MRSPTPIGALAPLRYAPFRFLVGGRVVSMLGNAVAPIALAFAVLDLTGSASDLGLVVGARSMTTVVFVLFGGVVADRLPRHLVMVASSLLAMASQAAVATLVLTHTATVGLLIALSAVNGLVSAFAFPAISALVAQTVPEGIRTQANALNRLGSNAAMILGASVGGLLVAAFGPGWGLAVDASTFLVAAGLFALVRVGDYRAPAAKSGGQGNMLRELRVGWTEFVSRSWVWIVVLGFCFFNMAETGALGVLGPAVADETFGRTTWGLVLAGETAGMVLGALVALRLRARRLLLVGVACCIAPPLFLVGLALTPLAAVLIPGAFLTGLAIEQFGIAWEVSLQEHIPADKLARVYSYDAMGSLLAMPLGQVAAGPLAVALGVKPALLIAAGVGAVAVLGMLASRSVRTLAHEPRREAGPVDIPAAETAPVG
jgi:MFS family permease